MRKTCLKKQIQVAIPLVSIRGGKAIDEVDADILETSVFGPLEALPSMVCIVTAAQVMKVVVEEALDADAQTVNPNSF